MAKKRKKIVRKVTPAADRELLEMNAISSAEDLKPKPERRSSAAAAVITQRIAAQEKAKREAEALKLDESRVYFWRCRNGSPGHIGAFFTLPIQKGEAPILTNSMWYSSYKEPDQGWPLTKTSIKCQVCSRLLPVHHNPDGTLIPYDRFVSSMTREDFEALTSDVTD